MSWLMLERWLSFSYTFHLLNECLFNAHSHYCRIIFMESNKSLDFLVISLSLTLELMFLVVCLPLFYTPTGPWIQKGPSTDAL